MGKLTYYQESILTKLYGPLGKTDPSNELLRIVKFYKEVIKDVEDEFIFSEFKKMVEAKLRLLLPSDFRFFQLDHYKEYYIQTYSEKLCDFLEDFPDSLEKDFISNCIEEQQNIIDNNFIYTLSIENYCTIDIMQFVDSSFLDDFKNSSKRKIEFLKEKLKEITEIGTSSLIKEYPLLFISPKVYQQFVLYTSCYIIDFYIDYSYLKKRMEHERLIHRTKDNDFMRILFTEMKLINEKEFNLYENFNKLSSLKKSTSANREQNFNLVFNF